MIWMRICGLNDLPHISLSLQFLYSSSSKDTNVHHCPNNIPNTLMCKGVILCWKVVGTFRGLYYKTRVTRTRQEIFIEEVCYWTGESLKRARALNSSFPAFWRTDLQRMFSKLKKREKSRWQPIFTLITKVDEQSFHPKEHSTKTSEWLKTNHSVCWDLGIPYQLIILQNYHFEHPLISYLCLDI